MRNGFALLVDDLLFCELNKVHFRYKSVLHTKRQAGNKAIGMLLRRSRGRHVPWYHGDS
jgi:hypothetical protein